VASGPVELRTIETYGYLLGAGLMIAAGVVELVLGDGDIDLDRIKGEQAVPIEDDGGGRFERDSGRRSGEKTAGS
jgi:hypothetical protein